MKRSDLTTLSLAALSALVLAPNRASAQNETASGTANGAVLSEVVVTAQKREQTLQETPISIGVLTTESLESGGIREVGDILDSVGGVSFLSGQFTGKNTIVIRGVTADSGFYGGTPVSYYLDETSFGFVRSGILPATNAFDLARVEVLRGPQGTLYGASSLNGVVRVITNDPDPSAPLEARGRLDASSTDDGGGSYSGDLAVNIPLITDKLAARAVISRQEFSGWIDAPAATDVFGGGGAQNVNEGESSTYRLKVKATPTDRLSMQLAAWISRLHTQFPNTASPEGTATTFGNGKPFNQALNVYNAELTYDFDTFSLLGTASYSEYKTYGISSQTFGGTHRLIKPNNYGAEATSGELRATSHLDGPWNWSLGTAFRHSDERVDQYAVIFLNHGIVEDKSRNWAVFGELRRRLLDGKAELAAGLRYAEDEVSMKEVSALTLPLDSPLLVSREKTFPKVTPRVVLNVFPTDEMMLFASYAEGFRSGLLQNPDSVRSDPTANETVEPDTIKNYEIGAKGASWEGRFSYDLALYYMKWSDVQARSTSPIGTAVARNTGVADGMGLDVGLTVRPATGLAVMLNASWNGLEMSRPEAGGTPIFQRGDRINSSPEYTGSLAVDYTVPLGRGGMTGNFFGSLTYRSTLERRAISRGALVYSKTPDLLMGRVSLGVDMPNGLGVSLYVNNVTNTDDILLPSDPTITTEAVVPRPRTIGLLVNFDF